jgi:pimeloyl-ACP methyl ester carboxylesterase
MDKPTLLLVHGLVGSLSYFDPARRISAARAHTCDLPGYGALRNAPASQLSVNYHADYVLAHLRGLGCRRAWLLGHSMGGAVVMLAADRDPELIEGVINVEGNFTMKDAFWSSKIVSKTPERWAEDYRRMQVDIAAWLIRCGVEPNAQRVAWATQILNNQPATTLYTMAKTLIEETQPPAYVELVRRVLDRGQPVHLIAGQKSAGAWGLPDFVRQAAASYTEQPNVGHLMMLEDPDAFCGLVETRLLRP